MPAPETKSLVRQWQLLTALSQRHFGMTLREMADETGVTQRTIRRDLAVLQEIGFPLSETVSEHGRKNWRVADERRVPPLGFTWDEAIALYLGRRFLEPLIGTQVWRSYRRGFQKIRATLGESVQGGRSPHAPGDDSPAERS